MRVIEFSEYVERFGDASLAMQEAIEALTPEGGRLVLQPVQYDFTPTMAGERFYFVSNNDKSSKRIAMPFVEARNVTVEGNGAQLRFYGKMTPAVLDRCENICFRNLSIDFDRPFYTEGVVVEASPEEVILQIDGERFPYYVRDDRLHFTGLDWDVSTIVNIMQYSPETANLESETADCFLDKYGYMAETLPDGLVRLRLRGRNFPYPFRKGNVLVMVHATRENPGIVGTESCNLRFENVTVHHSEGMAFIFQLCENVHLEGCKVIPSGKRLISACADATHFVNCTGDIQLCNCVLESQCDDATNVHGIYTRVDKIVGNRLYLWFMHYQQEGVPLYHAGDRLRLIKCHDLMPYGACCVVSSRMLNGQIVCVEVDSLPEGIAVNDGVENVDRMPETVTITGCVTGKNRARSFLISCRGKVRIADNDMHSNGAAIWISGDCNYWYESGPVEDVEITGNRMECLNSRSMGWGVAAIEVVPEIKQITPYYHGRISVTDNIVYKGNIPLVHASCVRSLEVHDNRLVCADDSASQIVTESCQVCDRDNKIVVNG
ncbi:MAG: hypothetical protein IJ518_05395 [Clostridia bacterium]|nr:hypothetical protein [Clostridia bacterium]